jgi:hypothetical protein
MITMLGSIAFAYLASTGTVTTTCVVGRGLFRAARHMADGAYRQAGVEDAAALVAPALMSYALTCSLVKEVVDSAFDLAESAMDEGDIQPFRHQRAA